MLASPAEIELGLSLAKINGSQIRYVSFTNINKTIYKVFNPTSLWGGEVESPHTLRVKHIWKTNMVLRGPGPELFWLRGSINGYFFYCSAWVSSLTLKSLLTHVAPILRHHPPQTFLHEQYVLGVSNLVCNLY